MRQLLFVGAFLHELISGLIKQLLPFHVHVHYVLFSTIIYHKLIIATVGYQMGLSWIQLLVHDWSKFTPSEWRGYFKKTKKLLQAQMNFNSKMMTKEQVNNQDDHQEEEYGFLYHQNRNPHHLEYWISVDTSTGKVKPMKMPLKYVTELIVDWVAANLAYPSGNHSSTPSLMKIMGPTSQEQNPSLLNQTRQMKFLETFSDLIHPETKQNIHEEIVRLSRVFRFELEPTFVNFLENEFIVA
ncbi:hypothetical protein C9374_002570 [Naegleria lovaniensis]|uniref:Uncharacterized protein n=1 Tax=Naegleria lovaniensis TaxID=51637 RepID=A0AA88KLS6_NAELO|nr:uncharacterized protein C9374_002570 [Naegleria lovaniensis]KAG2386124.1 hypothetical protein C9374_002570 [Naegleria lovaniensis]